MSKFEVEEGEREWGCDVSYMKRGLGEYNIGANKCPFESFEPKLYNTFT